MKKFMVNWRLEHDGKVHEAGDIIEMESPVGLVANGTLSLIEEAPKPPTPTELLEQEAASFDPPVDLSGAKNNTERRALIDARIEADKAAGETGTAEGTQEGEQTPQEG